MLQLTIKEPIEISGTGLHTGKDFTLKLKPAEPNTGIVFHLNDKFSIPLGQEYIFLSDLSSSLKKEDYSIRTIEHLLSCLHALNIANLHVHVYSEETHHLELPILDGSSITFCEKILSAGRIDQGVPRKKRIKIIRPVSVEEGDKYVYVTPSDEDLFGFSIDFDNPFIGEREFLFKLTEKGYLAQIASAKTFCLEKDIEPMKQAGLIKGGNFSNAIVIKDNGELLNEEELTFLIEPVLHKLLDMIGDLYMSGYKIHGNFFGHKSSHKMNSMLIKEIFSNPDNFEFIS